MHTSQLKENDSIRSVFTEAIHRRKEQAQSEKGKKNQQPR